jgi:lysophospholipase L1-like esterase
MVEGMRIAGALAALMLAGGAAAADRVMVTPAPPATVQGAALPLNIGGRVQRTADGLRRQWPGTYLEGAFRGRSALIRIGDGGIVANVSVDGRRVAHLVSPQPGLYRVDGLADARHVLRVDVAGENQAGSTVIGGLYAARPLPAPIRTRRIEFIGDSHTVGYGNLSTTRTCTPTEVWERTDTAQGVAGRLSRRYGADYRVNAISGRGIVRNYDGGAGDTLPVAYPFTLFDKATPADDAGWHPQLIVIALGTNDFSTPLKAGERWATRAALHADYDARYGAFVTGLRARHPAAHILLWATDLVDGEIAAATSKVATRLRAGGDTRVAFVRMPKLAISGCDYHPSTADDQVIADRLARYVDDHPGVWTGR